MTLTDQDVKNIITKLLKGEDYRIEIVTLINAEFLQFAIDFFQKIIYAKINKGSDSEDWYKEAFLDDKLSKKEIAINSGLNMKTIENMYNSTSNKSVIDASNKHYESLHNLIQSLVEKDHELEFTLTLKHDNHSVDLNLSESLMVINTLAVQRAALRGGLWSTAGKRVEKPLMLTLCNLFKVSTTNYKVVSVEAADISQETFEREIDFYLCREECDFKCEVKLMGKGNPESADVVIARNSSVFIADKLSDLNKTQLDNLDVKWVELRTEEGYKKFKSILDDLQIKYEEYNGDLDEDLDVIFQDVF
jgi:hypothetical protein